MKRPFILPNWAERGFIVIAEEQTKGRPEYIRALRNHCAWLKQQSRIEALPAAALSSVRGAFDAGQTAYGSFAGEPTDTLKSKQDI